MASSCQRSTRCLMIGWLIVRLSIGVTFILHGFPKLTAGPERWSLLGGAMATLGISFWPVFWGFMAAITETLGGLLLALGIGTRIWAVMLAFVMLVATLMKIQSAPSLSFGLVAHSATLGLILVGIAVGGNGGYSLCPCRLLRRRRAMNDDSDTLTDG